MSDLGPIDPVEARRLIVAEWVSIAEGHMDIAQRMFNDQNRAYGIIAFHFQQAIEKMMKALLIARGVRPPKTHDLASLRELLSPSKVSLACSEQELRRLSKAVESTYPGARVSTGLAFDLQRITSRLWAQMRPLI